MPKDSLHQRDESAMKLLHVLSAITKNPTWVVTCEECDYYMELIKRCPRCREHIPLDLMRRRDFLNKMCRL